LKGANSHAQQFRAPCRPFRRPALGSARWSLSVPALRLRCRSHRRRMRESSRPRHLLLGTFSAGRSHTQQLSRSTLRLCEDRSTLHVPGVSAGTRLLAASCASGSRSASKRFRPRSLSSRPPGFSLPAAAPALRPAAQRRHMPVWLYLRELRGQHHRRAFRNHC